jgi:hypothetical protein
VVPTRNGAGLTRTCLYSPPLTRRVSCRTELRPSGHYGRSRACVTVPSGRARIHPVRSIDTVIPDVDEGPGCTKIEHCHAGTAPRSSSSRRVSRRSLPARVSRTTLSAARPAGQLPSGLDRPMGPVSSTPRSAANAGARRSCHSPLVMTDRSIAARASTRSVRPLPEPSPPDPRRTANLTREVGQEEVGFSFRAG